MTGVFGQDPEEYFDYQFDFVYLLVDEETISTYELTVPDGITVDNDSNSDTAVTFWVSGGTVGDTYNIGCKVVTSAGRDYVDSVDITIYKKKEA